MDRMSRRDLLATGSAVIAGTLVRHDAEAADTAAEQTAASRELAALTPAEAKAGEGYTLVCKTLQKPIAGTQVRMRTYNGMVPGPLLKTQPGYGFQFEGKTYDCGSKLGFLAANVAYALDRKDLAPALRKELKELLG